MKGYYSAAMVQSMKDTESYLRKTRGIAEEIPDVAKKRKEALDARFHRNQSQTNQQVVHKTKKAEQKKKRDNDFNERKRKTEVVNVTRCVKRCENRHDALMVAMDQYLGELGSLGRNISDPEEHRLMLAKASGVRRLLTALKKKLPQFQVDERDIGAGMNGERLES